MPDPEDAPDAPESRGRPVLTVLFWVGVGLAPIAALLLLVGQGNGPLRIAAVLAVLAVVLIGLSITLRGDSDAVRQDIEDALYEEIDELRGGIRHDIATAARATHKAFGEKLQIVHQNVEALQAQVEAMNARADRDGSDTGGYSRRGYEQASHDRTEGAHSGGPRMPVRTSGQHADRSSPAGQYGAAGPAQPAPNPPRSRRGRTAPGGDEDVMPRPHLAGNVVRHTETVQVTTRQTIVGPHGHDSGAGDGYGGSGYLHGAEGHEHPDQSAGGHARGRGAGDEDWSPPPARNQHPPVADERTQPDQRIPQQRTADKRGSRRSESEEEHTGDPADDAYWSSLRAGDRWASVRSDDQGEELQMGERRAALRADESGTEVRVEDRWAAVRREQPRSDGPPASGGRTGGGWADDRSGSWSNESAQDGGSRHGGRSEPRGDRGQDRRGGQPALPAGGVAPPEAWRTGQAVPDREPVRQRRRGSPGQDGYPPADDAPRAGGARRSDREHSDGRWH